MKTAPHAHPGATRRYAHGGLGAWPRAHAAMWAAPLLLVAAGGAIAAAQTPAELQARSLAASCAACHGTDGNALVSSATPRLAGLDKDTFLREMREFRAGARPATVMQQIAKGFTDAQTEQLAEYFAGQK